MKQAIHFDTEAEFREWFEQNLSEFGIRKIIVNQEVCPDYVVIMDTGETKRIEAELLAVNFKHHRHDPEKVDLIVAGYAHEQEVQGVAVKAVNRLWEFPLEESTVSPPPDGPLSDDELRLLNVIQFFGGKEMSSLGEGNYEGNCRIFFPFTPEQVARFPRASNSLFSLVSPKAKQFIKKYHYAIVAAGLSESACSALDSLRRRGFIKTRPLSLLAAAYDGGVLTHPGWIPTEVYATEKAEPFRKFEF